MNGVGVVVALEAEARTLGRAVRRSDGLWSLGGGALMSVGGMGSEFAAAAAQALADAGAAALMSFGLAGGLDPSLQAGSVVVPHEVISCDSVRYRTTEAWREPLCVAFAVERPVAAGALLTSPVSIAAVADKAAAFRETGAIAVDMESSGVARVAAARNLPFIAVRVIVDTAADALPRAVAAAGRAGHLNIPRLVGGLILAPQDLFALIGLARRYRAATRSLAGMARAGLLTPFIAGARVA